MGKGKQERLNGNLGRIKQLIHDPMKSTIHILKINEVRAHKIYCVFSNGEYRYIDLKYLLDQWQIKESDFLFKLYDPTHLAQVTLKNDTLTWPTIQKTKTLSNGMVLDLELDLDPIVLYQNSEIDQERDSAYQLGRALKAARLSRGLTQQELAERVGTSKSYISKIENSKSDIGYKTLRKIIDVGLDKQLVITDYPDR